MSLIWSAADLARITRLPGTGFMLMLECYFDDSGTHGGSPVVVWGGVYGTVEQFQTLDEKWRALLAHPLPGKPPLSRFHLAPCRAGKGEFSFYSREERSQVQALFRKAIVESGLVLVAYGIDAIAWDTRATGILRQLFTAQSAVFGVCVRTAFETAQDNKQKLSMFFDAGGDNLHHQRLVQAARERLPEGARLSATTFLPVTESSGLQAADIVANHFYRYAQHWLRNQEANPDPEFLELLKVSGQSHCSMFSEVQINQLVEDMTASFIARGWPSS